MGDRFSQDDHRARKCRQLAKLIQSQIAEMAREGLRSDGSDCPRKRVKIRPQEVRVRPKSQEKVPVKAFSQLGDGDKLPDFRSRQPTPAAICEAYDRPPRPQDPDWTEPAPKILDGSEVPWTADHVGYQSGPCPGCQGRRKPGRICLVCHATKWRGRPQPMMRPDALAAIRQQ